MSDKFDPYREALVVEADTEWPEGYDDWSLEDRTQLAQQLHNDPEQASQLEYVRTFTGFCRRIVVTGDDIERLSGQ